MTDIAKILEEDVPPEYITQRSGGGGIKLDYVTGRYVKQRLNEIFGWDGWSMEVVSHQLFPEECTAFVHLRLTVYHTPSGVRKEVIRDGMAYGHGRKGAEGFDFAIAEAVTDALKRAAVTLGQNLGLSLYPIAKGQKKAPKAPQERVVPEPEPVAEADFAQHVAKITGAGDLDELHDVFGEAWKALPAKHLRSILKTEYDRRKSELGG